MRENYESVNQVGHRFSRFSNQEDLESNCANLLDEYFTSAHPVGDHSDIRSQSKKKQNI